MKKELSKQILLSEDSQNPSEETAMSAEDLFHSFGFLGFSEEDVVIKLSDGRQLSVLVTFDEWKELFSSSPLSDYYGEEGEEDDLFPPGSMAPKILAAIRFLEYGGKKVIVSDIEKGWEAIQGKTGTLITKE